MLFKKCLSGLQRPAWLEKVDFSKQIINIKKRVEKNDSKTTGSPKMTNQKTFFSKNKQLEKIHWTCFVLPLSCFALLLCFSPGFLTCLCFLNFCRKNPTFGWSISIHINPWGGLTDGAFPKFRLPFFKF